MAPMVSPALAHGRMIKQRQGVDTKVVFIGPCLSKIREIDEHPESADAALSFRKLDEILDERRISIAEAEGALTDQSPFSRIYPVPEGILRDVSHQSAGFLRGRVRGLYLYERVWTRQCDAVFG